MLTCCQSQENALSFRQSWLLRSLIYFCNWSTVSLFLWLVAPISSLIYGMTYFYNLLIYWLALTKFFSIFNSSPFSLIRIQFYLAMLMTSDSFSLNLFSYCPLDFCSSSITNCSLFTYSFAFSFWLIKPYLSTVSSLIQLYAYLMCLVTYYFYYATFNTSTAFLLTYPLNMFTYFTSSQFAASIAFTFSRDYLVFLRSFTKFIFYLSIYSNIIFCSCNFFSNPTLSSLNKFTFSPNILFYCLKNQTYLILSSFQTFTLSNI